MLIHVNGAVTDRILEAAIKDNLHFVWIIRKNGGIPFYHKNLIGSFNIRFCKHTVQEFEDHFWNLTLVSDDLDIITSD